MIIGENFIGDDNVCMILGDNIFYGHDFSTYLLKASQLKEGNKYWISSQRSKKISVVNFRSKWKDYLFRGELSNPKSNIALTGLYFYDNKAEVLNWLKPSNRGELEITDLNKIYLNG